MVLFGIILRYEIARYEQAFFKICDINWNVSIVLPYMFVQNSSNELAGEKYGRPEEHDSQLRVHLTHKMQGTQENVNSSQKVIINNCYKIRTSR